jgi:hypothetical protein
MKKLLLVLFLCIISRPALPEAASVGQSSKEANFRLQIPAGWSFSIEKTVLDGNPAWLLYLSPAAADKDESSFNLIAVDGRKNDNIRQTSRDFADGHAQVLLYQLLDDQKAHPPAGFTLQESVSRKSGRNDYIIFKFVRTGAPYAVYRIITAYGNYMYSFNCKVTPAREKDLELLLSTLEPYKI